MAARRFWDTDVNGATQHSSRNPEPHACQTRAVKSTKPMLGHRTRAHAGSAAAAAACIAAVAATAATDTATAASEAFAPADAAAARGGAGSCADRCMNAKVDLFRANAGGGKTSASACRQDVAARAPLLRLQCLERRSASPTSRPMRPAWRTAWRPAGRTAWRPAWRTAWRPAWHDHERRSATPASDAPSTDLIPRPHRGADPAAARRAPRLPRACGQQCGRKGCRSRCRARRGLSVGCPSEACRRSRRAAAVDCAELQLLTFRAAVGRSARRRRRPWRLRRWAVCHLANGTLQARV
eukprot:350742-Chlamydomonas_euryale.AAC.19